LRHPSVGPLPRAASVNTTGVPESLNSSVAEQLNS
jgi:hypothetical protein